MRVSENAVALESIIREWVTFIWTRGDSCRTWGRDSGAWGRASTSADRGAKAAAGRLGMIVDRFFDGLVCVSTLRLRFDPKQKSHALWDRAHRSNNFNHAEFPARCHKRSNVETAFSMTKAKFGGAV